MPCKIRTDEAENESYERTVSIAIQAILQLKNARLLAIGYFDRSGANCRFSPSKTFDTCI